MHIDILCGNTTHISGMDTIIKLSMSCRHLFGPLKPDKAPSFMHKRNKSQCHNLDTSDPFSNNSL